MTWVAGADGCRIGWVRVSRHRDSGVLCFDVIEDTSDLLRHPPRPAVLAVDMPIGLSDAGPRACDRAARLCLGPRRGSVFPAPVRPALQARSREEASRIAAAQDGRGVGAQAWNLYGKIRALDALLQSDHDARKHIREVHPEVSFWAWSGRSVLAAKKTTAGQAARLALAEAWLGDGLLTAGRCGRPKSQVADDDILDAVAVLWTAERIAGGKAATLPEAPPLDATGLPMQIVY